MAFTIDLGANEGTALPVDGAHKEFLLKRTVDFTEAANQLAQTEIMNLFNIPANVLVEEVFMVVETADTDVTDVDIGSFTNAEVAVAADGFIDGGTLAATGIKRDLAGETYSRQDGTAGYVDVADGFKIGLTNNDADAINEAVVSFYAVCKDLN